MITQTINLNLIPGGVLPRINVSQYDKGSRTLQFNLYNGVTPFTIPDGSSVYVVGTKADKTGFDYEATYTGGLVSIDVTEQMTAFAGDVEIEIRIIKSGEQIATGNFVLCVERTALADDTVISETDIPIIQHLPELVAETEENAELAHKWATFGDESEEPSATNNAKYWAEQAEAVETDKAESSALAPVEDGATASQPYAVGEHFYRDGAFCTAKASIAQGAQFTLNTNYTAGNIADRFNGIEVTNDNGVSGVIDQIKASFNSASDYSIYQGSTSGGKEAGWYGFRRNGTKSSSALVLMDVHLYKLIKLANEDTWKMYLIS